LRTAQQLDLYYLTDLSFLSGTIETGIVVADGKQVTRNTPA